MNSTYISNKFLNWLLNGQTLSTLPSIKFGLLTVMPDEDGLNYSEPVAVSYSRVTVTPDFFSDSTQMRVENILTVYFPVSSETWGTIVGAAIFEMDGALAWASPFTSPVQILANKRPAFEPGSLVFSIGTIPDGYYEGGEPLPVPDGYYEGGEPLPVPDGYYEGGEMVPIPATVTAWGWQKDLTTEQWQSHLAASEWITLEGCTSEQAAAAYYVEDGELCYEAALSIAAGASHDFVSYLKLPPNLVYTVEGKVNSQRDLAPLGGFFDFRVNNEINGVPTNFPSINRDSAWFRSPASPDNNVSSFPPSPGQPAYLVGINNSAQTINNFSRWARVRFHLHKWAPNSSSSQPKSINVELTDSTYTFPAGSASISDGRSSTTPGLDFPDNARSTLYLLIGTVAGVTNNAKGRLHTVYFMSKKIEF